MTVVAKLKTSKTKELLPETKDKIVHCPPLIISVRQRIFVINIRIITKNPNIRNRSDISYIGQLTNDAVGDIIKQETGSLEGNIITFK